MCKYGETIMDFVEMNYYKIAGICYISVAAVRVLCTNCFFVYKTLVTIKYKQLLILTWHKQDTVCIYQYFYEIYTDL